MDPSFMPSRKSFERAGRLRYSLSQLQFYCLQRLLITILILSLALHNGIYSAGRFDIARALEKWGGLHEVSRLLSLKPRRKRSRQDNLAKDRKNDEMELPDVDSEMKTASRPYISQDTHKWHKELKQLDINWVE